MDGSSPVRILPAIGCSDRLDTSTITSALRDAGVALLEVADERSVAHEHTCLVVVADVGEAALHRVRMLACACDHVLVLVSTTASARERLALLDAGATDVLAWEHACDGVAQIAARLARWTTIATLLRSPLVRTHLVGQSHAWQRLLHRVVEISHFTHASVLLSGESGTGKELVARLIHTLDPRPDKRELVVLDCTTIVPTLAGSEFFGHERGAFTGANAAREGAFELAHGGTLFLDEVGDLPLSLQAQLLRAIQEHTYKRVGGNAWHRTEFRLVCATHRDLAALVARGEFRHDLYHRIATWTFRLPALAERRDDVLLLARHFVEQLCGDVAGPELDDAVASYLLQRPYPGNVRELRHTIQRLVDRHPGHGPITVGQIPDEERAGLGAGVHVWPDPSFEAAIRHGLTLGVGLKAIRKTAEDLAVSTALTLESGSVAKASRRLGVTERALQLRRAERRREGCDGDEVELVHSPALTELPGTPPH